MSNDLIKCLLSHEFYTKWGNYITSEMFTRELQPLLKTINYAHTKYGTDLTTAELRDIHFTNHPTMSQASKETIGIILDVIDESPEYNPEIARDVLAQTHTASICRQLMDLAANIEAGLSDDWGKLTELQEQALSVPNNTTDNGYDVVDLDNIDDIVGEDSPEGEFKFNIPEMQVKTSGCFKGALYIIGARPEAGKTAFHISLTCSPGGFIWQGANIHIWRNEERYQFMARRAVSAILQVPSSNVGEHLPEFQQIKQNITGTLAICKDTVTSQKDVLDVKKYIDNNPNMDILIIDQIDNLRLRGQPARNDVKLLEEVYATIREYAIYYSITIFAITQAGADADDKLYFGYSELYGSKTGKGATGDVILCLGYKKPNAGNIDSGVRAINYSKNKFGGTQASTACVLNHDTSTFM